MHRFSSAFLFSVLALAALPVLAAETTLTIDPGKSKPISPDLFGIFFEDISYAADGGLYAELIQNRSFEYQATEQPDWGPLSFWSLVQLGGGEGRVAVDAGIPVHPNNPRYLKIEVKTPGEGVGVSNPGFDGIPVQKGETYDVSFFARQLYAGKRWGGLRDLENHPMPVVVRLESKDGRSLGEAALEVRGLGWQRHESSLIATDTDAAARFVLLAKGQGGLGLDEISLFPRTTFKGRRNGLRPDLAQVIADLRPRFVRFPGGCVAHGNGLGNLYHWKDTVGPIEQRRQISNLWGYHQSMGLGYFEYFQFCEDIGAKPLPVVAAGVSCQNSGGTDGQGQCGIPLADMPAYIQDVLDLVEWANGPATSTWGAVRAAAGHPAPFGLKYLGVGNEDKITPAFKERFRMIYEAVKKAHPEIVVIGTVGPAPDGEDYEKGWEIARELRVSLVDEHYYQPPRWFWENLRRYDRYDRAASKVYVGEYAARSNKLEAALAEAAAMTAFERNGDVVALASYAPLLAKRGYTRWSPDLIYFENAKVSPTVNYWAQWLFARNAGDTYLETTPFESGQPADFAASTVRDGQTGDLILKIVNAAPAGRPLKVTIQGTVPAGIAADLSVLADPAAPPASSKLPVGPTFDYTAPATSLSIIRIPSK